MSACFVIASYKRSGVVLIKISYTRSMSILQITSEFRKRGSDTSAVFADPPFVDALNWNGVEVVLLVASRATHYDQMCLFQNSQMLHHAESSHAVEMRRQLRQRLAVVCKQRIEDDPAARIGQRLKNIQRIRLYVTE